MAKKEKKFWPIEGVTRNEVLKSQSDTRFNFLRTRQSRRWMIGALTVLTILVALSSALPTKASSSESVPTITLPDGPANFLA